MQSENDWDERRLGADEEFAEAVSEEEQTELDRILDEIVLEYVKKHAKVVVDTG